MMQRQFVLHPPMFLVADCCDSHCEALMLAVLHIVSCLSQMAILNPCAFTAVCSDVFLSACVSA